jgi:hypothetical protein
VTTHDRRNMRAAYRQPTKHFNEMTQATILSSVPDLEPLEFERYRQLDDAELEQRVFQRQVPRMLEVK